MTARCGRYHEESDAGQLEKRSHFVSAPDAAGRVQSGPAVVYRGSTEHMDGNVIARLGNIEAVAAIEKLQHQFCCKISRLGKIGLGNEFSCPRIKRGIVPVWTVKSVLDGLKTPPLFLKQATVEACRVGITTDGQRDAMKKLAQPQDAQGSS